MKPRLWLSRCLTIVLGGMLLLLGSGLAQAEVTFLTQGRSNRLIVFVDPLWGEPGAAFRPMSGAPGWPDLMASDRQRLSGSAPLAAYDTAVLTFGKAEGTPRTIPQVASKALGELKTAGLTEHYASISFVAYSTGGLVLESMLIQAAISRASPLVDKTAAVLMVSVPADGPAAVAFIKALGAHAPIGAGVGSVETDIFLQGLASLWHELLQNRSAHQQLGVYCLHETKPTFGIAVQPGQYVEADCDGGVTTVEADHETVVRPASREAPQYVWMRERLAAHFGRLAADANIDSAAASAETVAPDETPAAPAQPAATNQASAATPAAPAPAPESVAPAAPPVADPVVTGTVHPLPQAPVPPAGSVALAAPAPSQRHAGVAPVIRPLAGDWTFAIRGEDCNLPEQLWVVRIRRGTLESDDWSSLIGPDGSFEVHGEGFCSTVSIEGKVQGARGAGWYAYENPCAGLYCRAPFRMTHRRKPATQ